MTKICLLRHGETEWNNKKVLMGQTDIPLNEKGKKQAAVLASYLESTHFDHIYSSDLSRAAETAMVIAASKNITPIFDTRLRECSAGKLEGKTLEQMLSLHPSEVALYREDEINYLPPEGERRKDFVARVSDFAIEKAENHPGQSLAFVCHGGVIRALLSDILAKDFGLTTTHFSHAFRVDNCSVSVLKYKDKKWEICTINDTTHLNGMF